MYLCECQLHATGNLVVLVITMGSTHDDKSIEDRTQLKLFGIVLFHKLNCSLEKHIAFNGFPSSRKWPNLADIEKVQTKKMKNTVEKKLF